jgi:hypothetical protein
VIHLESIFRALAAETTSLPHGCWSDRLLEPQIEAC